MFRSRTVRFLMAELRPQITLSPFAWPPPKTTVSRGLSVSPSRVTQLSAKWDDFPLKSTVPYVSTIAIPLTSYSPFASTIVLVLLELVELRYERTSTNSAVVETLVTIADKPDGNALMASATNRQRNEQFMLFPSF